MCSTTVLRTHFLGKLVLALVGSLLLAPSAMAQSNMPELPRAYVDTTYVAPTGRTISVAAGGDFQAALNAAQPGDVIILEAGATFTGPFTLPVITGTGWIVVRTSAPDSSLPAAGTRVTPSYASVMPRLVASSGSVLTTASGAHHFRFIGIEIKPSNNVYLYNLVDFGTYARSMDQIPHHLIIDRCYLHGDPSKGTRRGIALNSADTAIIDSYLADFKEVGADSQAIAGWNGPGPFKIVNNHLEGAGENLLFGGADPSIPNLVPADIEIRYNHVVKPLSWKVGDPSYAGTHWSVKNLLELKNARRLLIEGNLFEQTWADAQVGFAILFTVRNQDGTAPWSTIEDVTFRHNIVRHASSAVSVLGTDDVYASQHAARLLVQDNLFDDIDYAKWGGGGRFLQIASNAIDFTIDHNTSLQTSTSIVAYSTPNIGFVYTNNIIPYNISGTSVGSNDIAIAYYFPDGVFTKNALVGTLSSTFSNHPNNFFPASLDAVGFVDRLGGDYHLAATSPYKGAATDGRDVGANIEALFRITGIRPQPPTSLRVLPSR
jgi:hypothetical protein